MNKRLLNIPLLALVLVACGQDGVENGPNPQPDLVPPSVEALTLSTQVNTSISTTVELVNDGDAPLTILATDSDSGWLDVQPPSGGEVPAGSSGQVTITASCGSDTGERQGTVFIEHDDPDEEEIVLDVTLTCGDGDDEEPVDDTPPEVAIEEPVDGATVSELPVVVSGSASDDVNVVAVDVHIDGGRVETCDLQTDGDGVSFACSVDGLDAGEHALRVVAWDAAGNSADASISVAYEPGNTSFDIQLVYYGDPGPTSSQRELFDSAAERWASVIASDLPNQNVDKEANECGVGAPAFSDEVDDVLIFATITDIDGSGGVQAEAGPCLTRSDGLPLWGAMRFDEADLDALEGNSDLETVIRHEMGHVLGIGTLWEDLVQPQPCPSAGEPHYVGQHGVAEWHSYGASGDVPVEDDYGQGTDCGHWDEEELHFELMTGILDADMRLSRITIGSLEDLGFSVDYSAADSYPLLPSEVRPQDEPGFRIQERLITPIR